MLHTASERNAAFVTESPYNITVQAESLTYSDIQISIAEQLSPVISFHMAGAFQIDNLQTALTWVGAFNQAHPTETISLSTITNALSTVTLAGRMEVVQKSLWLSLMVPIM
ncbi:Uncharacterised protein [Weissella viridescens]|uniref:Uncharacterized protein n=1 Tax=Weissella viridescens TaxID=1629 RepID=A0A380P2G9_WEIVI|nr:Uncharacterised protein [Weissella viridescens]